MIRLLDRGSTGADTTTLWSYRSMLGKCRVGADGPHHPAATIGVNQRPSPNAMPITTAAAARARHLVGAAKTPAEFVEPPSGSGPVLSARFTSLPADEVPDCNEVVNATQCR